MFTESDEEKDILRGAMSMMKRGAKNLNPLNIGSNFKSGMSFVGENAMDGFKGMKNLLHTEKEKANESELETAEQNKKAYLQKYGLEFEVPSEYIQSSIFYPKDSKYIL
jgi:hypothetical protein